MSTNKYSNFVRPSTSSIASNYTVHPQLSGIEAKKLYLEEVKDIGEPEPVFLDDTHQRYRYINSVQGQKGLSIDKDYTDKDLFVAAQNNDICTLTTALDKYADRINTVDNYGWSLLMIACQANSVDAVRMLLERNIDTSIRDKADNSANSLVIKNKNIALVDLLLDHKKRKTKEAEQLQKKEGGIKRKTLQDQYFCELCGRTYFEKQEHLSSTIHNINASKGKKIPASYAIPCDNKGYQLMIKGGWDRESGLGPDGAGRRNPIRTVQKRDRKGLGLEKKKQTDKQNKKKPEIIMNKRIRETMYQNEKRMEALFRREFY